MRIAVEEAEHEYLMQIRIDEILRESGTIGSDGRIVDAISAASLLDNDDLADKSFDDTRDMDGRPAGESGGETSYVLSLLPEINLFSKVAPNLVDDSERLIMFQAWRQEHGDPCQ